MKKRLILLPAIAVFIAALLVLVSLTIGSAATASISFPKTKITVRTGQTFTYRVLVNNVSDLYAWQFDVKYDPRYVELVDVITSGQFLSSDGVATYYAAPVISSTTTYSLAQHVASTRLGSHVGVSGSGAMAKLNLRAVGTTSSTGTRITVLNAKLVDRNAQSIAFTYPALLQATEADCDIEVSDTAPFFTDYDRSLFLPFVVKNR